MEKPELGSVISLKRCTSLISQVLTGS